MASSSLLLSLLALCSSVFAAPTSKLNTALASALSLPDPYKPVTTTCPSTPLVRPAVSLDPQEASYIAARKPKADAALAAWLEKQGNFSADCQPTVALTFSGGGYRALLEGAGVQQAFDARDSSSGVSGLLQGLSYQAGLSGKRCDDQKCP